MSGTNGFLYSQIGYDANLPKQMIIRSDDEQFLSKEAVMEVLDARSLGLIERVPVRFWGRLWKTCWWQADFSQVMLTGDVVLRVTDGGQIHFTSDAVAIGDSLLMEKTWRTVAMEQMEARAKVARGGRGWLDCGADLREVNSHASFLIGLFEFMENTAPWVTPEETTRLCVIAEQGLDYIASCQDRAEALGFGDGAMIHEIPTSMRVLPVDVMQSAVAFAKASRLLAEHNPQKSLNYLNRAERAFAWLRKAEPPAPQGFEPLAHGAPENYQPPHEWMTRELLLLCWAAVELVKAGRPAARTAAYDYAGQVLSRQIPREAAEDELYGHFYTFSDHAFSEKAWTHHHVCRDTGTTFPNYLVALTDMCRIWYDQPEAAVWRQALLDYAQGYLIPACNRNPFQLLPVGFYQGQGLLWFGGIWHGINAAYGWAAALAADFDLFFGLREEMRKIIAGNLLWIAGLNAGITRDSLAGSLKSKPDVPEGQALPFSMISGIGQRSAGSWTGIRGSICNGFDLDEQFTFNHPALKELDAPDMFTDEDWITHSGAWLAALGRLRLSTYFFG